VKQHHDKQALRQVQFALAIALATRRDQMMVFPVCINFGKIIYAAIKSGGRHRHEGDRSCCKRYDLESQKCRFVNPFQQPLIQNRGSFGWAAVSQQQINQIRRQPSNPQTPDSVIARSASGRFVTPSPLQ